MNVTSQYITNACITVKWRELKHHQCHDTLAQNSHNLDKKKSVAMNIENLHVSLGLRRVKMVVRLQNLRIIYYNKFQP